MDDLLNRQLIFVKDLNGEKMIQATTALDLHDGQTGQLLMQCRESDATLYSKAARFYGGTAKKNGPFDYTVVDASSAQPIVRVARKAAAFKVHDVCCFDGTGELIGEFKAPIFSISRAYDVVGSDRKKVCRLGVSGALNSFHLKVDGAKAATVHLGWRGENQELYRQGFTRVIQFHDGARESDLVRKAVLASALAVDFIK